MSIELVIFQPVVFIDQVAFHHEDHGVTAADGETADEEEDPEQQELFSCRGVARRIVDGFGLVHGFLRGYKRGSMVAAPA